MKTRKELFQQVVNHLGKQRATSMSDTGDCMYRNDAGLMCAVGCLINEDLYDPRFEGVSVRTLSAVRYDGVDPYDVTALLEALEGSGVDVSDRDTTSMLIDLQRLHDNSASWSEMGMESLRTQLSLIAATWDIEDVNYDALSS